MNYIIDPAWFYWAHVVEYLGFVFNTIAVVGSIATVCVILFHLSAIAEGEGDDVIANSRRWAVRIAIIASIFIALTILTPTKDVMVSMLVAKFATYDNAQWTLDTVKAAVDYIVQAIQQLH